ncbi:MAG TPA: divalent-cation tolerance protein CutA [Thermoanaerobaculia bacterium]|nr:divalent-cation tolerance protein CutA [Thermoanaerobaculia bacterium]
MTDDAVLVLTTTGAGFDVRAFARELLDLRVAACVTILPPMTSFYRWEGRIVEDVEQQLILKTTRDRVDALREAVFARHPYELPEFVILDARASAAYGAWLRTETTPAPSPG